MHKRNAHSAAVSKSVCFAKCGRFLCLCNAWRVTYALVAVIFHFSGRHGLQRRKPAAGARAQTLCALTLIAPSSTSERFNPQLSNIKVGIFGWLHPAALRGGGKLRVNLMLFCSHPRAHGAQAAHQACSCRGSLDQLKTQCIRSVKTPQLNFLKVIAPLERNIKPDEFISFNGGGPLACTTLHAFSCEAKRVSFA